MPTDTKKTNSPNNKDFNAALLVFGTVLTSLTETATPAQKQAINTALNELETNNPIFAKAKYKAMIKNIRKLTT